MTSRRAEMQDLFAELSEENKEVMLLIAKSMKPAKPHGLETGGRQ